MERYLQYFSELCAGTRAMPEGLSSQAEDPMAKVVELQTQVLEMGIPAFVRACAAMDGETIPQAELDSFDLPGHPPSPGDRRRKERKDGDPQYLRVFLDSICLEESLLAYLIDLLRRRTTRASRSSPRWLPGPIWTWRTSASGWATRSFWATRKSSSASG